MDIGRVTSFRELPGSEPRSFTVGVNAKSVRGGGRLTVGPGAVAVCLGPVLRRVTGLDVVVHRKPSITVISTRLMPPWLNTSVVVEDVACTVVASTTILDRRTLFSALQWSGLRVLPETRWFSIGGDLVR